jgi:hypothetical protein
MPQAVVSYFFLTTIFVGVFVLISDVEIVRHLDAGCECERGGKNSKPSGWQSADSAA